MSEDAPKKPVTLDDLREAIDRVDARIHDLLMERAGYVLQVGEVKGDKRDTVFYRPEREAQIHRRLAERHEGPLPISAVHRVFREIISASLNLEKPLRIAYLGPEAAFTHQAALKHFGSSFSMAPSRTIDEVFDCVELERAEYGVAPVENSVEGIVNHTYDRFVDSPLQICAEIVLPEVHNLLSMAESAEEIKAVYCHYQAFARSRGWLKNHMPNVPVIDVESTAKAAEMAVKEPGAAAIAGVYAADNYGLNVLAEHLEDQAGLENRFLVVGRQSPQPSGSDKTSLMLSFPDRPGVLHEVLGIFAREGVNLTKIESRPSKRRKWDYLFFVDLAGHQSDPKITAALETLGTMRGTFIKVLGTYPCHAI